MPHQVDDGAGGAAADSTYIWGTTVSVADITNKALTFIKTFRGAEDSAQAKPKYVALIVQVS